MDSLHYSLNSLGCYGEVPLSIFIMDAVLRFYCNIEVYATSAWEETLIRNSTWDLHHKQAYSGKILLLARISVIFSVADGCGSLICLLFVIHGILQTLSIFKHKICQSPKIFMPIYFLFFFNPTGCLIDFIEIFALISPFMGIGCACSSSSSQVFSLQSHLGQISCQIS